MTVIVIAKQKKKIEDERLSWIFFRSVVQKQLEKLSTLWGIRPCMTNTQITW
jgi:hypothetical protein